MKSIHIYENLFLIFPYSKINDVYYIWRMMDLLAIHLWPIINYILESGVLERELEWALGIIKQS